MVTTSKKADKPTNNASSGKKKVKPTVSKHKVKNIPPKAMLTFGKQNYLLMGIGIALVFVGIVLMSGGDMPSPEVWDENIIYGFRRTVLAPILIVAGLVVEIFAIFKNYHIEE